MLTLVTPDGRKIITYNLGMDEPALIATGSRAAHRLGRRLRTVNKACRGRDFGASSAAEFEVEAGEDQAAPSLTAHHGTGSDCEAPRPLP